MRIDFGWFRGLLRKPKVEIPRASELIPDFILARYQTGDHGTFGLFRAVAGPGFMLHMIELPWKNNQPNISCIPKGTYQVNTYQSRRFGRCWQVMDVEGRTYILIHPGNLAGDMSKGYSSHLRGCLSPGKRRGKLVGKSGKKQDAVVMSRPALTSLMNYHGWEPFILKITEAM